MTLPNARQIRSDANRRHSEQVNRDKAGQRVAQTLISATFRGHGFVDLGERRFDVTYLQEPTFTSGVALVKRPDPTQYAWPQMTPYVIQWVKDTRGLYLGARLGVACHIPLLPGVLSPTTAPDCTVTVHYSFQALAHQGAAEAVLG